MSSLIHMFPTVKEEQTFKFEYEGESFEALITPMNVFVANIGEFSGATTKLYSGTAQHMCGLQGYDPMLGDSCPKCNSTDHKRSLLEHLKKVLIKQGLLEKKVF